MDVQIVYFSFWYFQLAETLAVPEILMNIIIFVISSIQLLYIVL